MKAKILTILLALFAMFWTSQVSFAQIITTAPTVSACSGTQISVPITVDNFNAVASMSITLNINPSVITYVSYTNNPGMAGGFLVVNSPAPYTQVKAAWFGLTPLTLANGSALFTFTFNYLQGSCPLNWDLVTSGNCQYSDVDGNTLSASWVNGSVGSNSPNFTTQPVDFTVSEGNTASFDAGANNANALQWQESTNGGSSWANITDGPSYTGTTSATLSVLNTTVSMNGYKYHCVATATACNTSATSDAATLHVSTTTTNIISQIGSVTGCQGSTVSVPVTATNFNSVATMTMVIDYNAGALTYVSLTDQNAGFNGTVNASASAGVLTITYTGAEANIGAGTLFNLNFYYNGGSANLTFSNISSYLDGGGLNLPATFVDGSINASAFAPSVTANPVAQTINANQNASFQITATGADTYQWQIGASASGPWVDVPNGTPYSGATSNTLTLTNVPLTFTGQFYRCVAIESVCSLSSASGAALLTVLPSTTDIVTTIGTASACPGGYVTIPIDVMNFNDVASASMKINYDTLSLTYDSVNTINPALTSGFSVFNAANGQVGMAWFAIVPASFGTGLLYNIVFHHDANSSPLTFDLGLGICQYTDINFTELPSIWVNGAVNIPGPVINTMPVSQTAFVGTNAVFTISGTNITSYQWQRKIGGTWTDLADGTDYAGTSSNTLTVNNCTLGMDGYQFRCAVDGTCGIQFSYVVNLMVINSNPVVVTLPTVTQCQGPVTIPITVSDFNDIGSFSLTFNTTGNILTYNGYQGANNQLPGMTITNSGTSVTIAWTGGTAVSLGNATLVTIKYNSMAGVTPLTWDVTPGTCYFKSISNTVLPKTLNSGNVTINAYPGAPAAIQGPATVCQNSGTSSYSTTGASNATSYMWAIIPSNAGTIAGTGLTAVVTWDAAFTGLATITVKGVNACGNGPIMSKATTVVSVPVVTLANFTSGCTGDTITLTGGLPIGGTYSGPGVVNGQIIATQAGSFTITYTVTNAGCTSSATGLLVINLTPAPGFTLPSNLASVCYYWPAFNLNGGAPVGGTYSGIGVTSATGVFTPSQAIVGFQTLTYSLSNAGCIGTATDIIEVSACIGIPEVNGISISVVPNPTNGIFRISIQNVNESFEMGLYNDLGQKIFTENINPQNNEFSKDVDLSNQPKGLYFLKLSGNEGVRIEKIVVH